MHIAAALGISLKIYFSDLRRKEGRRETLPENNPVKFKKRSSMITAFIVINELHTKLQHHYVFNIEVLFVNK